MDRYLTTQLLMPFLFGVASFSSIILAVGSLFELVRQVAESGLPIVVAGKVMALTLPQFVVYSFPMSMLLAAMMTYGRLSGDSEIIALRSGGVSVYRLVMPAIVIGIIITGITFGFNEALVPAANQEATATLQEFLKQDKPTFKQDNIIYPLYGDVQRENGQKERVLQYLIYARKFDGKNLEGAIVIDRSKDNLNRILNAQSASWDKKNNVWVFSGGTAYFVAADASYKSFIRFQTLQLELPLSPLELTASEKKIEDMNIAEMLAYSETARLSGDEKKLLKIQVTIQQKLAFPFICIIFAILGSAMGIRPQRSSKATSFGLSVLLIFGYYLLIFVSSALGQARVLSPFLAGWLPNCIGFTTCVWMLLKVGRR